MSLPHVCIRRPVMTVLIMLTCVVMGWFGYRQLPVSALPQVDFPTIQVSATLPGASPETMAVSVASPLERQFSTISGIASMSSLSAQGSTSITLQFDLNRDIDGAALDVQSAISVAQRRLPLEMPAPPSFRKVNPADSPVLFIALTSDTLPLYAVHDVADTQIAQRLSTLPGVAQVSIYGSQKYAVRAQVDLKALTSTGLTFDDLQQALSATNSNKPLGVLSGNNQTYTLQASGQLQKAEDYRPLIVAWRNGSPVKLSDVANVIDSVENNKVASWLNGTRSILLAIQRQPDANTIEVVDRVKALLPVFRAQLPAAVDVQLVVDRSQSIRESVADVQFTLVLTIVLVVLVIFLFLRSLRATLIPALALPISLIGTFAGMYLLGFSINNLTLLALTLSVGFVVDDAIVMLENIVRYLEKGLSPLEAALKGSKEIVFTIVSITLSLVAVFIPVLFMGGIVGRVFREFAVTISLTILISGLVSLTLTPLLASRMLKAKDGHLVESHNFVLVWFERAFNATLEAYRRSLDVVMRYHKITLGVTVLSLVASVAFFIAIPKGFFPVEDTGVLLAITEANQDISFPAMVEAQKKVADIVRADPAVQVVNSAVGAGGPNSSGNSGRIFIALKPLKERKVSSFVVIQRLRQKLAAIPTLQVFMQPIQNISIGGRLSKSLYQYSLQGNNLQELQQWAPLMEKRLAQTPGFLDVTSDLQLRSPQAFIEIDRERAATLGVTPDVIRSTLYSAYGNRQVATIYTAATDYQVILEADPSYQQDMESLQHIHVRGNTGQLIPLTSLASITRTAGPLTVSHTGLLPSVTLSFNLASGLAVGDALQQVREIERDVRLPAGITSSFQGAAQVFQDSLSGQGLLIIAAMFVVYVVLGILYESYIHPITILSGLPSAGLGALLVLMLFKMDLSVIAIIGMVMLIGIVKKNAIMMIDFAIDKKNQGETSPEKAIYEACLLRFRPIMMTTMAALMGTLPIALGIGAGSEFRQPLGIAVVGGLLVSQLLTLYITPVIYITFERLKAKWQG